MLRKAYRAYWLGYREHSQSTAWPRYGQYPPLPAALRGLTCGAKTRSGHPCARTDLHESGRCKFHGGLSTGPLSEAGKQKSRENGKLGGRGRVRKPNPMNPTKNRFFVDLNVNLQEEQRPISQQPEGSLSDNSSLSVRVQCRDCANLSAGFTCLSPASGQRAPAMGEWRICAQFLVSAGFG